MTSPCWKNKRRRVADERSSATGKVVTGRARSPRRWRRLGILGGTFNPIHIGHLRCAEEITESLKLDRVLFVPSASPPHKSRRSLASARHRLKMVELAVAGHRNFGASAIEIERGGPSYSVDTLRLLRQRPAPKTELFFILGHDAFVEIETWKDYSEIFSLAHLVVIPRPPRPASGPARSLLPIAVRREFCYRESIKGFVHRTGHQVLFRRTTALDISASDIRHRVARRRSIRYLVPREVGAYILRHRLYRSRAGSP